MKKLTTHHLPLATRRRGFVSLGAILLLGAVIVEIALVGAFLVYLLTGTNFGIRVSAEAFSAAGAGIAEGMMRVIRNPDASGLFQTLTTGNASVQFRICKDYTGGSGSSCGTNLATGKTEVIAVGTSFGRDRKLVAILDVDPLSGLVSVHSIEEKPR